MTISELLLRKNNNLDLIRIVLASLVIIGHAQFLNGPDSFFPDPLQSLFYYTYSGAIAVKLFFFVSGLVVANSLLHKGSPVLFIISRVFRLMPALVFIVLVTALILGPIFTKFPMADYFTRDFYRYIEMNLYFKTRFILPGVFTDNHYTNTVNGSLWTLRYEVACYVFTLGIYLLMWAKRKSQYLFNIPILIVLVVTYFPQGFMEKFMGTLSPESCLLPASFAFGVFCAVNANKIKINVFTILPLPILYFIFLGSKYQELIMIYMLCIFILYLCSRQFMLKLKPKRDISYGIYLWGFLIQQGLYYYFGHMNIILHILISISVAVGLAIPTYFYIEKPGMDLGKKLSDAYLTFMQRRKQKKQLA